MEGKDPGNPIFAEIQALLKRNQAQVQEILKAFHKALEDFNQAVLNLGLDAKYPFNPGVKKVPVEALVVLANGLKNIPNLNPQFADTLLIVVKKLKAQAQSAAKAIEEEKKAKQLEAEVQPEESKNLRFSKILKAANLKSDLYPLT